MTIRVETTSYQIAHGRSPRGKGLWAFALGDDTGRWLADTFFYKGSYTNARNAAKAKAKAEGLTVVSVQP